MVTNAKVSSGEATIRDRLLDAALEVFLERGFDGTRVGEVARRAGLTTGAIYSNFDNKAALLSEAIVAYGSAGFLQLATGAAADGSARRGTADLLVQILAGEPGVQHRLVLESFAAAPRDEQVRNQVSRHLAAIDGFIRAEIERAREDGRVAADVSTDAYGFVLGALVLGSFVVKALGLHQPEGDVLRTVIERLLHSVE